MAKLTKADLDRMRSVGFNKRGLTRNRVVEGRSHSETGVAFKAVTDEAGNTVTEHNNKDDRVDVMIRPKVLNVDMKVNS
ncbi:MAG: hypothetical protein ACREHG_06990 [Candidatus Saccharimonadales bacterium]